MLYEINKRPAETPTFLRSMLHLEDELLYASVSVRQYDGSLYNFICTRSNFIEKIENLPDEIFCTSDEYYWIRKRFDYANLYGNISNKHRYTDSRSNYVFLIGEPGCGKTAYCLNLLQKWCQRDALQKFEYVFYVESSVLQISMKSLAFLISTSPYGDIYSEIQIDNILRTEKCLVIMDGDNYFNEKAYSKKEVSEHLIRYSNCVFVFTMRILDLLHEESFLQLDYMSKYVPTRVIELLGLDEHGMTSLYSKIDRSSGSRHKTDEGDYQLRIKKSTAEKETKQPEADLHTDVKVSDDVQKKWAGSNTSTSDSEQELKEMKDYDIKYFNFNKIKEMLQKELCDSYDSIMKIPMLGSVCVRSLVEGKDVPRNRTSLYLCLVDKLAEIIDTSNETLEGIKEDKSLESYTLFQPYANIHRHVSTLCKLGKIAYDNTYSPSTMETLNYKKLEGYLDKTEMKFSSDSMLIAPVQTLSDETCVRFVHKSIQDSLVAMYIVTEKYYVFESLCQRLTSMNVVLDLSHVIMMICGLNPYLGIHITKIIKDTMHKDRMIQNYREIPRESAFLAEFYKVPLSWYTECKKALKTIGKYTIENLYVSDIYIDENTDTKLINETITLMSDKNVVVTALYVNNVPPESGLSDTVLTGFLAMNTSLESISIRGRKTERSIEPLSIPSLRKLDLRNVRIQCTKSDDDTSNSLLFNLPKLETLKLRDIHLNNVLLGLTFDKGRMPLLKDVDINDMDIGDQSIELAPDMTNIECVWFNGVKMSPNGWMKFIKSLINIHHNFSVNILNSEIDNEAKEIVRTNENFAVKRDNRDEFKFKRGRRL